MPLRTYPHIGGTVRRNRAFVLVAHPPPHKVQGSRLPVPHFWLINRQKCADSVAGPWPVASNTAFRRISVRRLSTRGAALNGCLRPGHAWRSLDLPFGGSFGSGGYFTGSGTRFSSAVSSCRADRIARSSMRDVPWSLGTTSRRKVARAGQKLPYLTCLGVNQLPAPLDSRDGSRAKRRGEEFDQSVKVL